jgi:hypothetical protein
MHAAVSNSEIVSSPVSTWSRFAEASSAEAFCENWLALQCEMIDGVTGALLLLGEAGKGPFMPAAIWPNAQTSMQHLAAAAETALRERRGLLVRSGDNAAGGGLAAGSCAVAYPVEVEAQLYGVIVVQLVMRPDAALQAVLQQIHWGAAWLEVLYRRRDAERQAMLLARVAKVMDVSAAAFCPGSFQNVAIAVTNQAAAKLECGRVSLGVLRRGYVELVAISHTAKPGRKANLTRAIEAAMEEASDQEETVAVPSVRPGRFMVTKAHDALAREHEFGNVVTVPLRGREHMFGVMLLERRPDNPFDPDAVELAEALAAYLGPVLETQWLNERALPVRVIDTLREPSRKLLGPGYFAWKLAALVVLVAIVFFSVATGDFRIAAKTVVEGEVQRAVVAPFDGYIAKAPARAGDTVRKGEILAELDDRDLRLEQTKLRSEKEQQERKHREATGNRDRAAMRIVGAQLAQAEAELALVTDKLARTRALAPFDGLVVSGDLSQKLGTPIQQGNVLFEVAPLDAYRVILQVDERDIAYVAVGQKGTLRLAGMPHDPLRLVVSKLTPVSTPAEGRNHFRVEARLEQQAPRMGPGMEGVGKIEAGEAKLIWIWTRSFFDWLRLWLWSWTF